jgi:predicted enzyme related to lactoylglutathione lyase
VVNKKGEKMKPAFRSVAPQFTVSDVVRTAKYYSDVLGFQTNGFFGEPPVFTIVSRDAVEFFFNQDPAAASNPRVRSQVGYDAYIHMAGVDELAEELRARGARIIEGPEDREYGMRELVIEDCNGLILAFGADARGIDA